MRRYLAAGIWLLLTVAATIIVWEAVSVVGADVTDRPAPVVAQREVIVALNNGSSTTAANTATTIPTGTPRSIPPTTANRAGSPSTTAPSGRAGGPVSSSGRPTSTTAPSSTPTTRPPNHSVPTTTTTPTTVAPSGATATYSTNGGVVAVTCINFGAIRLVAALPDDGYQALVISGGPNFVDVNFIGKGHNYAVGAACVFGQPFEFTNHHPGP